MKKLISLFLTLALTLTVFGTVAMAAPSVAAEETVTPDMVYISSTVADDVTTQNITYYPSTTDFGTGYINLMSSYEPAETWMFFRFPTAGWNSVTEVAMTLKQRFNTQAYARLHTLDEQTWTAATTGLTDNKKTIVSTSDDVFEDPMGATQTQGNDTIVRVKSSSTTSGVEFTITSNAESNSSTTGTLSNGTSGPLVTYINDALKEGSEYLYFAYTMSPTTDDNSSKKCRFYAGSTSLKLTGTKAVAITTSLDEVASITDASFTYSVTMDVEDGTAAIMLVGIYNASGELLDAVTSGKLVKGTNDFTMNVDLSGHADAASVKAFLWDGNTLEPWMAPISRPVA